MTIPYRAKPGDEIRASEWNKIVKALRELRLMPGAGVQIARTPGGITISVPGVEDSIGIIVQNTEPDPANWPQGWIWIRSSDTVGNHYETWFKTADDPTSNNSKILLSDLICQTAMPNAEYWPQGTWWIDTNDEFTTGCYRPWIKTANSTGSNASRVPLIVVSDETPKDGAAEGDPGSTAITTLASAWDHQHKQVWLTYST